MVASGYFRQRGDDLVNVKLRPDRRIAPIPAFVFQDVSKFQPANIENQNSVNLLHICATGIENIVTVNGISAIWVITI